MKALMLGAALFAIAVVAVGAGAAGAVTPVNGGAVGGAAIVVNAGTGDQNEPHVSGNLAVYTDRSTLFAPGTIHYFDFLTGADGAVPGGAPGDSDVLSDVEGGRIVFSRTRAVDNGTGVMLFDASSSAPPTELNPEGSAFVERFGAVIGGGTVAYAEFGTIAQPTIFAYDLATGTAVDVSQSPADLNQNPALSSAGDRVVWERCVGSNCDILQSVRSGTTWGTPAIVSATTARESNPDVDGTTIVYDSERPSATGHDIYMRAALGGPETALELAGIQRNPSISSGVIAFEDKTTPETPADVWIYVLATNTRFRVSDTPTVDETLNDVTVLPSGDVRVVWAANDDAEPGLHNVRARTFPAQLTPGYDFAGFFSPVNNPTDPQPLNSVKAGQSVPVKFSLGGNQGLDVLADDYPKLVFTQCHPGDGVDPIEETSTANNGLTYNALTDTYTYVWKTVKGWKGKCGTFTLKLDNDSVHTADFVFK